MAIETERLILRPWEEKDIEPLAKLYADSRVMAFWEVRTLEESKQEYDHFPFAMEVSQDNEELIGRAVKV